MAKKIQAKDSRMICREENLHEVRKLHYLNTDPLYAAIVTNSPIQDSFYRMNGIRSAMPYREDEIGNKPDLYGDWCVNSEGGLDLIPSRPVSDVPTLDQICVGKYIIYRR